ncbi:chromate transporter, partial [Acinetobacter baumannii]
GIVGGIAVLIAFFLPASVLTLVSGRLWEHFKQAPAREALRRGLAPITIGLMLSGAVSIAKTAIDGWQTAAMAVVVLGILLWRSLNPLWL